MEKLILLKVIIVKSVWFVPIGIFYHGFKLQSSVCNGCHDLTMLCPALSYVVIITVKGVDYRRIIHSISKSKTVYLVKNLYLNIVGINKMHFKEININSRVDSYHFDNLINAEKLETKHILIDEKNCKDFVIIILLDISKLVTVSQKKC